MAISIVGFSTSAVAEVAGTTFRALNVVPMPQEYGALGSYRRTTTTGTIAAGAAANSDIVQFRWTDVYSLAVVNKIVIENLGTLAVVFTAGFGNVRAIVHRNWSTAPSGGALIALTGNDGKLSTSMTPTRLVDGRVATTAALTAGTRVSDSDPIGQLGFSVGTIASINLVNKTVLFGEDCEVGQMPLVCQAFDGFSLQATLPATGTWRAQATFAWTEVVSY